METDLATTPEFLEWAGDIALNDLAQTDRGGCQKPLTWFEKWSVYWAAVRSRKPVREMYEQAVVAVGIGWPSGLVAMAIEQSEAYDARGFDHWLFTHGYQTFVFERCAGRGR